MKAGLEAGLVVALGVAVGAAVGVELLDLVDVVIFASMGSVAGFIRTFLAVEIILEPIQSVRRSRERRFVRCSSGYAFSRPT